jgi:SAM-dependent methyltransferase
MAVGHPMAPRTPPAPAPGAVEPVPLAVWPCAQASAQAQRAGRHVPASTAHPGKMLPELARRIVAGYAPPGGLIVDPMCGIGTTLVEAAALGRRALGVGLEPRWAEVARANLTHALPPAQAATAQVRVGDARQLPALLADVAGAVDLVATSPPYACTPGVIDKPAWLRGQRLCRPDTLNYSPQPGNLGHARGDAYLAEMARVYAACHQVLRPGGLLVTVTRNLRRRGRVLDLAGATVTLAEGAGFCYLQHVVALLAAVRDSGLLARPSFWQLTQTRKARARGEPASLVVHEDVLVFAKPMFPAGSRKLKGLQREPECSSDALSRVDPWVGTEATGSPS